MKKVIMISVSVSAFLASCLKPSVDSQIAEEKFEINSPFENIDVAFSKYSIVNEKGGYVKLPDGGFINIPKNAFENNLGEIVKGGVVIEFRDFHNPAEIIASGIPMSYDSAGVYGDFQSAGMYEIRAFHNGSEVDVVNGKSLEIGLVSSKPEDDYKFYDLKEDGQWNYNFNCKTKQNKVYQTELKEVKKQLGLKKPVAPLKADDSKLVFDFSFDETKSPELAAFKNILWSPFESNKNIDDIIKSDVREVKVTKNDEYDGVYNLLFTIRGKETLLLAQPVFMGSDYDKASAQFEKKMKSYKNEIKIKQDEINRLTSEQQFLRTSFIRGMGVYNYDRLMHNSDAIFVDAQFKVKNLEDFQVKRVYLVSDNEDVIYYDPSRFSKFGFVDTKKNIALVVLPNDKVATFEFKNNSYVNWQRAEVELSISSKKLKSPEEIHHFLQSI